MNRSYDKTTRPGYGVKGSFRASAAYVFCPTDGLHDAANIRGRLLSAVRILGYPFTVMGHDGYVSAIVDGPEETCREWLHAAGVNGLVSVRPLDCEALAAAWRR